MEPSTDTNRLYELLRKLQKDGLKPEEINELSNEILKMAGTNIIAQFNANLEAIQVKLDALAETNKVQLEALREANKSQWEALDGRYKLLLWLIGGVGSVLTFILAYGTFFAQ